MPRQADTGLYLSQAYRDAQADWERALNHPGFPVWDEVILTASNEHQAQGYRQQLQDRRLPSRTRFTVLPDEEGKRIGSGGATLGAIRFAAENGGLSGRRLLVIHSGGDSKRVPQYSALGKLFSPVPHMISGRAASLFDELMVVMSSIPSRISSGMLLLSGDVLPLFNPLLIDFSGRDALAISFKEDVETGQHHGVYLPGANGYVKAFLHKHSAEQLRELGAVNSRDEVDVDTGAVLFSTPMLESLYALVDTPEKYSALVNPEVCLSLYGDFEYPLAADSTLEGFYQEKPEGRFTPELRSARELVWETLRPYRLKLMRLAPAKFIHFGTSREILDLMCGGVDSFREMEWFRCVDSYVPEGVAAFHSVAEEGAEIAPGCFLHASRVLKGARVGEGTFLSCMEVSGAEIPSHGVVHGLKLSDGSYVCRIFGTEDNPKENLLFGKELGGASLWEEGEDPILWNARLYPARASLGEALEASLETLRLLSEGKSIEGVENRKSLASGFLEADSAALLEWDQNLTDWLGMEGIYRAMKNNRPVSELPLLRGGMTPTRRAWLEKRLSGLEVPEQARLHYYVGSSLFGVEGDLEKDTCFQKIHDWVGDRPAQVQQWLSRGREPVTVELPLRVNWGGGWSDTPPYCLENGGTVLNCAIRLKGCLPVRASLRPLEESVIRLESLDGGEGETFSSLDALQETGNPFDPFALQKAALIACGVIPPKGGTIKEIFPHGGFALVSEVRGVPKGSGLGTSSILSAACVKALSEFFSLGFSESTIIGKVLWMEQLMSTGGGWQDQIGGLLPGIKFLSSLPGVQQEIKIQQVELPPKAWQELQSRFCLIYTGQRRLARNLLRDVVGRYLGNEKDALFALNEIQRVAALMRFELERGRIDAFGELLNRHWELSQVIDQGSTNTLIDQIFLSLEDLISARMICGAGGGGFLQVLMKKRVTREDVHQRLKEVFSDSAVDVWDCELV